MFKTEIVDQNLWLKAKFVYKRCVLKVITFPIIDAEHFTKAVATIYTFTTSVAAKLFWSRITFWLISVSQLVLQTALSITSPHNWTHVKKWIWAIYIWAIHIWGHTYLGPYLFGAILIWGHTYLGPYIFGAIHIWGRTYLGPYIFGAVHIWGHTYLGPCIFGAILIWGHTYLPSCIFWGHT